jgi:alpha-tubulin suppressor-like RCC1 family protein
MRNSIQLLILSIIFLSCQAGTEKFKSDTSIVGGGQLQGGTEAPNPGDLTGIQFIPGIPEINTEPDQNNSVFLALGDFTSCALSVNGNMKCWGKVAGQKIGDGVDANGSVKKEMGENLSVISLGEGRRIKQITSSCALLEDGNLFCWPIASTTPDPEQESIQLPAAAKSIAGNCALLVTNDVTCWGPNNNIGQLGYTGDVGVGQQAGPNMKSADFGGIKVRALTAGNNHRCAILENDELRCWGNNNQGQLGHPPGTPNPREIPIDLGTNRFAIQVSAGMTYTCAFPDNDTVKCWGEGGWSALGPCPEGLSGCGHYAQNMGDQLNPVGLNDGIRKPIFISSGNFRTCAIMDDQSLRCWGDDDGKISTNNSAIRNIALGTGRTATSVSSGQYHTCALLDNDDLKCWGYNVNGELGLDIFTPPSLGWSIGDSPDDFGDSLPAIDLGREPKE